MDVTEIRSRLERFGQQHLLAFWDELDDPARGALLADIEQVDLALVADLVASHVSDPDSGATLGELSPPSCVAAEPGTPAHAEARQLGETLVAEGKVAAMVVAGGQGTRLGFDGPKGTFRISPIQDKPLFKLFAESLIATEQRFGKPVPWYIMTSPATDAATRDYFAAQSYFGLEAGNVFFFQQGVMPAVDPRGRILLAEKDRLAMSPDGHGGSIRALASSGALADLADRGVEVVSYFQVDNPLVTPVDPLFVGMHQRTGSQMSSLVIGKASDTERVGVFALAGGQLKVIEYSDLPETLATARNADGSRTYDAANIAIHALSRTFVEQITRPDSSGGGKSMPWHRARKAVPYIDATSGRQVTPDGPNAVKFEMFIFDALPLADNPLLLESRRSEVFSPVKNADGVDSPATARRDLVRRAATWLAASGVSIPRATDGEPDCTLEISPLAALDADQLAARLKDNPPTIEAGARWYLSGD